MRVNRELIGVFVLLAIFVVGGLLLGGPATNGAKSRVVGKELIPDPSVYNDRASGSKGVFEWTRKLGYRPEVWRQDWTHLHGQPAPVLLAIDPQVEGGGLTLTGPMFRRLTQNEDTDKTRLDAADARRLREWLRAGHTAILLSSRLPTGRTAGAAASDPHDLFADALDMIVETASPVTGRAEFAPLQPVAETAGVLSVHSEADARIKRGRPDGLALFGDESGPLVLSVPVGAGRLVAIADGGFVSNANLARSENAVVLANLLARAARPGETILFDEFHHGDAASDGASVWDLLGRPLQLTVFQLLLAGAIVLGVVAIRFGVPIPLGRGVTRTSAEYVESLAGLYARAQAAPVALETIYRQFLRDLSARLALAPDVNLEQLAAVAARRGKLNQEKLRRLLAQCEETLDGGKTTEAELLDLTRRMDAVRKEIGIV